MAQGWYETTSSFEQGDGGPEDEAERKRRAAVIIQRLFRGILARGRADVEDVVHTVKIRHRMWHRGQIDAIYKRLSARCKASRD